MRQEHSDEAYRVLIYADKGVGIRHREILGPYARKASAKGMRTRTVKWLINHGYEVHQQDIQVASEWTTLTE